MKTVDEIMQLVEDYFDARQAVRGAIDSEDWPRLGLERHIAYKNLEDSIKEIAMAVPYG